MRVDRLADGLWRWTASGPDGAEAGCVYHEHPDGIVLVDPVIPADEADRFWRALDRDVERVGRPPLVAVTLPDRAAGVAAVLARYPGARALATADGSLVAAGALPGGLVAIAVDAPARPGRALIACPCHGLLWTADLLAADPDALRPLLPDLLALAPRVLVPATGEPIVDDAAADLARLVG